MESTWTILLIIQAVSYPGITLFIWRSFWNRFQEYTLYYIRFRLPSSMGEYDDTDTYEFLAIIRHVPGPNAVFFAIVIVVYLIEFGQFIVKSTKKIKFYGHGTTQNDIELKSGYGHDAEQHVIR